MNKQALVKALKEAARLLVFAIPGILIQVVSGDASLSAAYGGAILTVLKSVDKYIHTNQNINAVGLVPF